MVHRFVIVAIVLADAIAPVAWAADMEGKLQSVDSAERTVVPRVPDGYRHFR